MSRFDQIIHHPAFQETLRKIEKREHDRVYCRHGLSHLLDVCRILYIEVLEQGLAYEKDVVYAAGLLHDIGRLRQEEDGTPHECSGLPLAERILTASGYTARECRLVLWAIAQHRTESPRDNNNLGALLYQADKQSRPCFFCRAQNSCNWPDQRKNQTLAR